MLRTFYPDLPSDDMKIVSGSNLSLVCSLDLTFLALATNHDKEDTPPALDRNSYGIA